MSKPGDDPTWSEYLRASMDAVGIANAAELARRTGVNESQISRWLRGLGQPDLANLRKVAPVLKRPMLQLLVAAGHLTPAEAKVTALPLPTRGEVDVVEAIELDTHLLPEAKEHFLNQYALLLRVAARDRKPTPEEAVADVRSLPAVARKPRPAPRKSQT